MSADPATIALTGQLPFLLIASAILALPVSLFLLWLYRKAVIRGMGRQAGQSSPLEAPSCLTSAPVPRRESGDLHFDIIDVTEPTFSRGIFFHEAKAGPSRTGLIYAAGGLLFAAVIASSFLLSADTPLLPLRFISLAWIHLWPLLLTLAIIGFSRSVKTVLAIAYFLTYILLSSWALARSPDLTISQVGLLWVLANIPPTVLYLLFLMRRVRAVGPLIFTFMFISLLGSLIALATETWIPEFFYSMAWFGFAVGLEATGVVISIILLGFLLFGILGWCAAMGIRKSYQAKWISDQSLTLDNLWLLFAIVYSVELVFEGFWWILTGPAAFLIYLAAVRTGFFFLKNQRHTDQKNIRMLLLRVFSLGKRSERLFAALTSHWRHIGSVQLITGPDLATATVEPHEFLDFVSGRLRRQFIDGPDALARRLKDLDLHPDFDGRYRVNDFFCRADTWKMTLKSLVGESDVILMDLRGLSPGNAGCVYELHELVNAAPFRKVILAIDNTTDLPFLEQTLKDAWQGRKAESPNQVGSLENVRMVRLSGRRDVLPLLQQLCIDAEARVGSIGSEAVARFSV